MPAYNFKARFADLVASGAKPHTIRKNRLDGYVPKVGDPAYLYTGMRTRSCRLLRTAKIIGLAKINISHGIVTIGEGSVNYPGTRNMLQGEAEKLAQADGFSDSEAFFDFFAEEHGSNFAGYLIEWGIISRS